MTALQVTLRNLAEVLAKLARDAAQKSEKQGRAG